jgi:hypothetical protein
MQQISKQLSNLISSVCPQLDAMSEAMAGEKPYAQKWSRKEILGHLIDSAANNHQRFVRMQELLGARPPLVQCKPKLSTRPNNR